MPRQTLSYEVTSRSFCLSQKNMAISVVMPALELMQEAGKLLAWRKKEGESVAKGEPLLEIETDKAVVEIEAPADGILAGVEAAEGAVIPVGKTIAWIVQPGEKPPKAAEPRDAAWETAARAPMESGRAASPQQARSSQGEQSIARAQDTAAPLQTGTHLAAAGLKISPKARRLAREHGVDIGRLRGSGPEGEILASDVLALVESSSCAGKAATEESSATAGASALRDVQALGAVGRVMAERTTRSWTSVPHFFVTREVDAGALVKAREKLGAAIEKARSVRLTHTDLLVALVARVLRQHPRLNASWANGAIRYNQDVNIGVAIAVEEGVVAAVIHHADKAGLGEIAARRNELVERARAARLRPADITGATFTISNLGMYGVDAFTAVINPPQAAILAVGRIAERVVAVDGRPGIRRMMSVTLSCDHRVVDGGRAASFLNDLAEVIREAEKRLR